MHIFAHNNGRLAPFAKHHGSLVRSVEFHKMVVVVVWSLLAVNYYIFGWYFTTYINAKWLKGLLECKSCVETRNYDGYCFRFYEIRLKSRRSNVKIWLQFTVYTTKIVFFNCFTRWVHALNLYMICKGNGMLECKCHFSDRWLFTKFLAVKVVFINKRLTTHALIKGSISNQNTVRP